MLEELQVVESPARITAVIRFRIPAMDLPGVMGPAIEELAAVLVTQGVEPVGPLFNHYLSMDSGMFDFEVGFPVNTPATTEGRVTPGHLPAARVVRTTYRGPYAGLHHAWREFGELARAQGMKANGGFWESYVVGPETSPDPAAWRTELNQPLLG